MTHQPNDGDVLGYRAVIALTRFLAALEDLRAVGRALELAGRGHAHADYRDPGEAHTHRPEP